MRGAFAGLITTFLTRAYLISLHVRYGFNPSPFVSQDAKILGAY